MRLHSIQIGQPRSEAFNAPGDGKPRLWLSSIVKLPVTQAHITLLGLEGDGQADTVNHGGVDKAVHAYALAHYADWRVELNRPDLVDGSWGENLTVSGFGEQTVCIGDIWQVGGARLQVSQPRQPCWKLARRQRVPDLVTRVVQSARPGWYLRVLQPGTVNAGEPIMLVSRVHPQWTIARAAFIYNYGRGEASARALAQLPELAESWRTSLA